MSAVITIESDDDDEVCVIPSVDGNNDIIILDDSQKPNGSGYSDAIDLDKSDPVENELPGPSTSSPPPVKRIKPTLISHVVTSPSKKKVFGAENSQSPEKEGNNNRKRKEPLSKRGAFKRTRLIKLSDNLDVSDGGNSDEEEQQQQQPPPEPQPQIKVEENTEEENNSPAKDRLTKEFRKLILTCKTVDSSVDMEKLIRKKLIGYYREVPPEFVTSKIFCELVAGVTQEIKASPHLIYLKITRIIEELKPRRVLGIVKKEVISNGEAAQAVEEQVDEKVVQANAKKAAQIKKLNKALTQLKKRIDELDQEEVDFEEDQNSAHMKVERYKKRACQIYEKLCEISGESKHAQRSARKPIKFHGTVYPEFNKTLQAFVNRTNMFPDYFDVKKCLEHCNELYDLRLRPEQIKGIAQDAFIKVGKILQKRRKMDLFEMVSYFGGTEGDPADEDNDLQEKLCRNKQYHSKIGDIIDKFADDAARNGHDSSDHDDGDHGDVDDHQDEGEVANTTTSTTNLVKQEPVNRLQGLVDTDEDDIEEVQEADPLSIHDKSRELFEMAEEIIERSADETESIPNEIDIIDSVPVFLPDTIAHLPDSVNMDQAIEMMVSNDPFEEMMQFPI